MSFGSDLAKFCAKVERRVTAVHDGSVQLAARSVQYGSELTGSKGQPVDKGDLRDSIVVKRLGQSQARIFTDKPYGPSNEDGIARPGGGTYRLLSKRGGRWSFRLTQLGFHKIVAYVVRQITHGADK